MKLGSAALAALAAASGVAAARTQTGSKAKAAMQTASKSKTTSSVAMSVAMEAEMAGDKKIEVALDAVKLMKSGVAKYLSQEAGEKSAAESERLLKQLLGNFQVLGKVMGSLEAADMSKAAAKSSQETERKLVDAEHKEKDLQDSVQSLINTNDECKVELAKMAKTCKPSDMSKDQQDALIAANADLTSLNKDLGKKIDVATTKAAENARTVDQFRDQNTQLMKKLWEMAADKKKLMGTMQQLLHNDMIGKLKKSKEQLMKEKAALETQFAEKRDKLMSEEELLEKKNGAMQEDLKDMKKLFQGLDTKEQKCEASLKKTEEELAAVKKDKESVMSTMQTILRQNTQYQESLLKQKIDAKVAEKKAKDLEKKVQAEEKQKDASDAAVVDGQISAAAQSQSKQGSSSTSSSSSWVSAVDKMSEEQLREETLKGSSLSKAWARKLRERSEQLMSSGYDVAGMSGTDAIDRYHVQAEIAQAESSGAASADKIAEKSPTLANYLGFMPKAKGTAGAPGPASVAKKAELTPAERAAATKKVEKEATMSVSKLSQNINQFLKQSAAAKKQIKQVDVEAEKQAVSQSSDNTGTSGADADMALAGQGLAKADKQSPNQNPNEQASDVAEDKSDDEASALLDEAEKEINDSMTTDA